VPPVCVGKRDHRRPSALPAQHHEGSIYGDSRDPGVNLRSPVKPLYVDKGSQAYFLEHVLCILTVLDDSNDSSENLLGMVIPEFDKSFFISRSRGLNKIMISRNVDGPVLINVV
jgi:hypothetical protein